MNDNNSLEKALLLHLREEIAYNIHYLYNHRELFHDETFLLELERINFVSHNLKPFIHLRICALWLHKNFPLLVQSNDIINFFINLLNF